MLILPLPCRFTACLPGRQQSLLWRRILSLVATFPQLPWFSPNWTLCHLAQDSPRKSETLSSVRTFLHFLSIFNWIRDTGELSGLLILNGNGLDQGSLRSCTSCPFTKRFQYRFHSHFRKILLRLSWTHFQEVVRKNLFPSV